MVCLTGKYHLRSSHAWCRGGWRRRPRRAWLREQRIGNPELELHLGTAFPTHRPKHHHSRLNCVLDLDGKHYSHYNHNHHHEHIQLTSKPLSRNRRQWHGHLVGLIGLMLVQPWPKTRICWLRPLARIRRPGHIHPGRAHALAVTSAGTTGRWYETPHPNREQLHQQPHFRFCGTGGRSVSLSDNDAAFDTLDREKH